MWAKIRSALVDFSGIWQSLLIFASIFGVTIDLGAWKYPVVGLLCVMLYLGTGKSVRQVKTVKAKRVIEDALTTSDAGLRKGVSASGVIEELPKQEVLESAYLLMVEKAKAWSEDVKIGSFEFRQLHHQDASQSFGLEYYSEWKSMSCRARISSYYKNGEEIQEEFEKRESERAIESTPRPFFQALPKWRHAVLAAISAVSDELDMASGAYISASDDSRILSKDPRMTIYVSYSKGKVDFSKMYRFDGELLVDTASKKKIAIK
jgi:hypothetical protein